MTTSAPATNQAIARRFDQTADLLEEQGTNPFRVRAYRQGAATLRRLEQPVERVLQEEGVEGLDRLAGIGPGLAAAIRDYVMTGRMPIQERLRGTVSPIAALRTVPGVGQVLARRMHDKLGITSLEDLEAAAWDGRLETMPGFGRRRLAGIRQALAGRLARRGPLPVDLAEPPVEELLDVDREYREQVAAHRLPTIAPRRMNPSHQSWLPILHTRRGERHYTALYSNTPRAHELGRTHDWVVLYLDDGVGPGRSQFTVVTQWGGPLDGRRVVRGREHECSTWYHRQPQET